MTCVAAGFYAVLAFMISNEAGLSVVGCDGRIKECPLAIGFSAALAA
jgi:hypothetical protein